ncbi:hypothetical protein PVL29_006069 [Vitis rotundifolia]|uniref:Agenet-like domain-containing protein n=1 Tax=Vitis rotundifolia TaxID=103349 RepID=A0AA39DYC9_VITRO|nr:hypothetical protein PVL29_006069 [Vitis rotundifolia]
MDGHEHLPFKVGQLAEARSFLQGFRGAWFRCKIKEISLRKGHIGHVLEYIDFPDEKLNWTKLYQKPQISNSKLKEKKRQLMVRPCFPSIYHVSQKPDINTIAKVMVLVNDVWKVGDEVDWWTDGCYWSGRVTQLLGYDKVRESESGRCCARLVKPVYYVPAESEGRTDSQGRAGSSLKCNPSFSSRISDCSSPPPDGSEHSPEKEMTEQPLNIADSRKRKLTLKTKMDLHKGDMGIRKTSSLDSVSSSHIGDTSEEMTIGGIDRCSNGGSSKKMGTDGSIALNSMHSDTLDAAILDLEELANKVKWVKGILDHGIPLPNALRPPWRFLEHHAPSTPK